MTPVMLVLLFVAALLAGPMGVVLLAVMGAFTVGVVLGLGIGAPLRIGVEETARWWRHHADTFSERAQTKRDAARHGAALRATRAVQTVRLAVATAALVNRGQVLHVRQLANRSIGPAPWPGHQPAEPIGSPTFLGELDGLFKEDR